MPYKITNISHKTFKTPVPLTITVNDGSSKAKHVIQPNESIILYFVPTSAQQLHIKNMVTIEHISNNNVLPTKINTNNDNLSTEPKIDVIEESIDNEDVNERKKSYKLKK